MGENLRGKNGISIKILIEEIRKEMIKPTQKPENKRKIKNSSTYGKLATSDCEHINIGLRIFHKIIREGFSAQERRLIAGNTDVSKLQKDFIGYKGIMEDLIQRLSSGVNNEYELHKKMELLKDYSQISQAARDGIITKREERTEIVNGQEKKVIYDTSMTPREVYTILNDYEVIASKLKINKLDNYLGLGLGLAGTIGAMVENSHSKDRLNKHLGSVITLGTTVVGGLKLLQGMMKTNDREQFWLTRNEGDRMIDELLTHEQISNKATESTMEGVKDISIQEKKLENKVENNRLIYNLVLDLAVALISGAYINSLIQTKENGKINGKSLAYAMVSLQNTKGITGNFINFVQGSLKNRKDEDIFIESCKEVQDIIRQMEEKVYPLEGAKHAFDSLSINNFTGKFYPKKDYETGQINYATIIKVPEFSMKRGDIVLLSGESGVGKSTFLRFLKRGDINNRLNIQLDNKEKVDNLGNEYISFKPSINLGDETNVLYQITGKKNISDLTREEQEHLETLLRELKFDMPDLLQQMSTKKFMEFSTGQQRRLAMCKVFYRINDGTSVIIVDEPVGHVEDALIREQLEMIKKYAQSKNVMLILTTHRIDLAEDLATKRYNINKDGVLEQIPIKSREEDNVK